MAPVLSYLLINNGHGYNVCDTTRKQIPWDLSDETKFTEKELREHLELFIEIADRIFARIERSDSIITTWGMFGRPLQPAEKNFIKKVFEQNNNFVGNKKKALQFVFN